MYALPKPLRVGTESIAIAMRESSDCTTLRSSLEWRGYSVFPKLGVGEILEMVLNATATVVIVAQTVPFEHCAVLCRAIRRISQSIPIIILHRGLDVEQRLKLFAAGADHCAQLPVPVDTILTTIQVLSRHLRELSGTVLIPDAPSTGE